LGVAVTGRTECPVRRTAEMDTSSGSFPASNTRVSDEERDHAVAELSEHFQAGRLTQDEFDGRSGQALRARTRGDLSTLFTDLPRHTAAAPPAPGAAASPVLAVGPGGIGLAGHLPVARVVIACAVAAIVAGDLLGSHGHVHAGFGWLVPGLIACLVFLRLRARR
jgi:hypothetical protein